MSFRGDANAVHGTRRTPLWIRSVVILRTGSGPDVESTREGGGIYPFVGRATRVVGDRWWDGPVSLDNPLRVQLRRGPAPLTAGSGDPATSAPGIGWTLDEDQRAAVAARAEVLRVLGGPGTGTSTVAREILLDRVRRGEVSADRALLIAPTRVAAARARDDVTARLARTGTGPLARTMASLGFGILRQQAALVGAPEPRLLSGAEQDSVLADLLAGHAAEGGGPRWPEAVQDALGTRGLRGELRDLLMRAVEHGVGPQELAALGAAHDRPEWIAGAEVLREYDEVTALGRPGAYDPAWILTAAADLIEDDPIAAERVRASLGLVVVDDAHELTAPAVRLIRLVTGGGTPLVLLGDPDATVQGFRGADPRALIDPWPGREEATVVLGQGHRLPAAVAAAADRVVSRIGALGGGAARHAEPARQGPGEVDVRVLRGSAQEAAYIAHDLRRARLMEGVAWSEMAVIVRGASRTGTLRRVLASAGVPVASTGGEIPLRSEPAVRPLLLLLAEAVELAKGARSEPEIDTVIELLGSSFVGADAVAQRRLRRLLRREELTGGGSRTSDELLTASVIDPERVDHLGAEAWPLRRLSRLLAAAREAAVRRPDGTGWAPGVAAETILWASWSRSGLAETWRDTALAGGAAGIRADRDLDAVVALFDAAARHAQARPGAGPDAFLEAIAHQDIAADSIAARAQSDEVVEILTPAAAAGRQWRRVVVAGVQDGVWPDLRLRGSLLGSQDLVDVLAGRPLSTAAARAQVRDDETRLFYVAITRASERLLVTAVRTEDEQPSVYLDLVAGRADGSLRPVTEVPSPLDLTGVVARLRQDAGGPDPSAAAAAVPRLARLRAEEIRGADPARWWALRERSDDRPLRADDQPVPVSPSRVETFARCGLRWLLTSSGGDRSRAVAAEVGTLIHAIAAELGDTDAATLRAEIDARWAQLGLPPGWVNDQRRARAHAMAHWLAAFYTRSREGGWSLVEPEAGFRVELGRAVLAGSVDRLEQDAEGRLRVIDYKTGSSAPTRSDLPQHPQLGTYQVAVSEGGFAAGTESAGAALVQLGKIANRRNLVMEQPALDRAEDPQWAHRLIEQTADGMAAAEVTARVDDTFCGSCPVTSSCPLRPEGSVLR